MKKKSLILFGLIAIIFFTILGLKIFQCSGLFFRGFGPGIQDFSKNVTNGYVLHRNSAHEIFIAPSDGWNDEIAIIPSKVLKLNDYEDFIVAERQGLKKRSPNDSLDGYEIPDENVKDYWILDTENNRVLKNMTKLKYQRKLDSLKIPKNIELIDVYKY